MRHTPPSLLTHPPRGFVSQCWHPHLHLYPPEYNQTSWGLEFARIAFMEVEDHGSAEGAIVGNAVSFAGVKSRGGQLIAGGAGDLLLGAHF